MTNNSLIKQIKTALQKIHERKYNSRSKWTTAFKQALFDLGKNNGYTVYPNKEKKESEWLLDLCWAKEGKNWQTAFEGLKLSCEIEWNRNADDIIYDFQKLTVIDSDIRLMIFQYNSNEEYKDFFEAIKIASEYTKPKGYNYLIAASGNNDQEMKFTAL